MNSNLSKDQLSLINSVLDKELSLLTVEDYATNTATEKENYDFQKPRGLTTKDFGSNSNSYYEKNYESNFKEPRDITNQGSFQRSKHEKAESYGHGNGHGQGQSARMQDDLIELQSKIVNLEKKLGNLNNSTSPPNEAEYSSSFQGRNTKSHKNYSNDLLDYSPLQNKYNSNKSPLSGSKKHFGDSLRDSSVFKDVSDSSSDANSPIQKRKTEKGHKSILQSSGKKSRMDKTILENSIKEAQSQLDQSKSMIKRRSMSRGRSGSMHQKSPSTKRSNVDTSPQEKGNYQEIIVLNKRVMELKKKRDEERSALQTERAKNQEMAVQLEKMNMKMKKMQLELERFSKIDVDYNKLMESFEKSEYIRNQQKKLIENLQQEIEELKRYENGNGGKSLLGSDDSTAKKKTTTTKSTKIKKKI